MQYELVSRALACFSCLSTMSLLLTSVAIIAVNVGKLRPVGSCGPYACLAGISIAGEAQPASLTGKHIESIAVRLWSAKA
jgi:hypothetical protein